MLYFDHCYTADQQHRFLRRMEKLGFRLSEDQVEHPGRHFCRFIMIPCPDRERRYTYLEFINVKPGGDSVTKPGLSFGYSRNLEGFARTLRKRGGLRFKVVHKNYDWKKDNRSRLPGWNFLTFQNLGLSGLFPWLTEYEKTPERTKRRQRRQIRHPNGVSRHRGFLIDVDAKGEAFFRRLLGRRKLPDRVRLGCGTEFHFSQAKRTRMRAVILECRSLALMRRRYGKILGPRAEGDWLGEPALRIQNPAGMWDILLVQR